MTNMKYFTWQCIYSLQLTLSSYSSCLKEALALPISQVRNINIWIRNRKISSAPYKSRDEILTQLNAADKPVPDIGTPPSCNSITLTAERQRVVGLIPILSHPIFSLDHPPPVGAREELERKAEARFRLARNKASAMESCNTKVWTWKSSISLSDSHSLCPATGRRKGLCEGVAEGGTGLAD